MDGFHDTIRYDRQHETTHAGAVQEKFLDFRRTCKDCCKREDCLITNISVYGDLKSPIQDIYVVGLLSVNYFRSNKPRRNMSASQDQVDLPALPGAVCF